MMTRIKEIFIVVAFTVFLSTAALCVGFCAGAAIGRWWGEWELFYLMDIPQGGMVMSSRTGANWFKLDNNTMRFQRIPDPRQARVVKLFPLDKNKEKKENENEETKPVPGGVGPAPRK